MRVKPPYAVMSIIPGRIGAVMPLARACSTNASNTCVRGGVEWRVRAGLGGEKKKQKKKK